MRARGRHVVGLIVVAGLVLLGAACDGGGGSTISAGLISRAAAQTGDESSARFEITVHTGAFDVTAHGAVSFDDGSLGLTADLPILGPVEGRIVDGVLYLRIPGNDTATPWVKFDLGSVLPGADARALTSGGLDPSLTLDSLRAAFGDVETVGRDELRGGSATHYRVTLDVERALERAGDYGLGSLSPQRLDQIRVLDGNPIDVWISDDGRVLKEKVTVNSPSASTAEAEVVIEFFDFGSPVSVEAPPASETSDWTTPFRDLLTI